MMLVREVLMKTHKVHFEVKDSSQSFCYALFSKKSKSSFCKVQGIDVYKKAETEEFESAYKVVLYTEKYQDLYRDIRIALRRGAEVDATAHVYGLDEKESSEKSGKIVVEGNIEHIFNMLNDSQLIPKSYISQIRQDNLVIQFIATQKQEESPEPIQVSTPEDTQNLSF